MMTRVEAERIYKIVRSFCYRDGGVPDKSIGPLVLTLSCDL